MNRFFLTRLAVIIAAGMFIGHAAASDISDNAPIITGYGIYDDRVEVVAYLPVGMREAIYQVKVGSWTLDVCKPGTPGWTPGKSILVGSKASVAPDVREISLLANREVLYTVRVRARDECMEFSGPRDKTMRAGILDKKLWLPADAFSGAPVADSSTIPEKSPATLAAEKQAADDAATRQLLSAAAAPGRKYKGEVVVKFADGCGRNPYSDKGTITMEVTHFNGSTLRGKIVASTSRMYRDGSFDGRLDSDGIFFQLGLQNKDGFSGLFSFTLHPENNYLVGKMNTWDAGGKCVPVDVRLEALPFTPAIAPPPAKDAALALPEWQRPFYPIVKAGKQLIGTMPGSRYPVNVEIEVTQTEGLKFKGLYQVMGRVGYLVGEMKQGGDGNGQLIIYLDVRKRITVGLYGEKLVGEMIDEKGTNLGEVTLAPRKATFPLTAPRKK